MADALKTFFSPALVRRLADDLARASAAFPARAFIRQASRGLDELELLDRAKQIARALRAHLAPRYTDAIAVILRSLGPELAGDELLGVGMAPFFYMPHVFFVAEYGLDDMDTSFQAQYELTKRFSCESSIRAFIARDPERTFAMLRRWAGDANPHVRRLVSEGTRLRLPWAMRVPWLDGNPKRVVELLDLLKDDPTTLVRRSVANSLNDLSKVHRELALATCAAWLEPVSPTRRALIEHALRSAVKRGDSGALQLLGFGGAPSLAVEDVRIRPARVAIGGQVTVELALRSTSRTTQDLLVDLVVHFVKASGRTSPKTFKLKRIALAAGATATFATSISLEIHTTRRPHPGCHRIDVLVNGVAKPAGEFVVIATPARTRGSVPRQRE